MKKIRIEIDVPDDISDFIDALAKFLKTKSDDLIKRAATDAVKAIPDGVEKHIDAAKLKKAYNIK